MVGLLNVGRCRRSRQGGKVVAPSARSKVQTSKVVKVDGVVSVMGIKR